MPNWIKNVVLDILILALIAAQVFLQNSIIHYILWGYTSLLLVGKIAYFFIGYVQKKANAVVVPPTFYHVVYFLSVALFVYATSYYLALAWSIIWLLSALPSFKKPSKK